MAENFGPTVQPTPLQDPSQQSLRPHRGVVVLVLGILGIVVCFICGIIAWVMGNGDLREMAAGTMDPHWPGNDASGQDLRDDRRHTYHCGTLHLAVSGNCRCGDGFIARLK